MLLSTAIAYRRVGVNLDLSSAHVEIILNHYCFLSNLHSCLSLCVLYISFAGSRAGDATVLDIRGLKYVRGTILYKINYSDDWTTLTLQCATRSTSRIEASPLYSSRPKIPADKYRQLQELKPLMPVSYHSFYDALAHD